MKWIKFLLSITLSISILVGIISCTQTSKTGPVEIKYDRDTCEECGMAISDNRFSTQIRGGKDRAYHIHKFDDIGCAIRFAKKQAWIKEDTTEFYVSDYESQEWLDATKANYSKVKSSPMGYGFAAHKNERSERLSMNEVEKTVLERLLKVKK